MSQIIAMWSGPRNLSTAMMRSFGARPDCSVLDEPFFAPYLAVTGKPHPGRAETLARHETDPNKVASLCQEAVKDKAYSFQKHMPHHMLPGFAMEWAEEAKHFFLIRDPKRVIASYAKGREKFDLADLGFSAQRQFFDRLAQQTGQTPVVIDSLDILRSPKDALLALCDALHIPLKKEMLQWDPGGRPEDGAWAPYWYKSVQNSTTFSAPNLSPVELSAECSGFLAKCQKDFKYLSDYKIDY